MSSIVDDIADVVGRTTLHYEYKKDIKYLLRMLAVAALAVGQQGGHPEDIQITKWSAAIEDLFAKAYEKGMVDGVKNLQKDIGEFALSTPAVTKKYEILEIIRQAYRLGSQRIENEYDKSVIEGFYQSLKRI